MSRRLGLHLAGLSLFAGLLYFYRLGTLDLYFSHEARAAQHAASILDDGHWLIPRLFDRQMDLQKPPLFYWLVALLGWCGDGVGAWAVRLPSALAGLACVLWICFVLHRVGRETEGWWAGMVLAGAYHFIWVSRIGRIDILLTLTVSVALGSFFLATRRHEGSLGTHPPNDEDRWSSTRLLVLGYVAVAVGILLKGPIAAVLVGLALSAWAFLNGNARPLLRSLVWGIPVILLFAGSWFIVANSRTSGHLWQEFFLRHNLSRALGSETLEPRPYWFYLPRLAVDFFPGSLAVPLALLSALRFKGTNKAPRGIAAFGLLWFVTIFLFLSIVRFKRADYLLPAYPGLAIFVGCWLAKKVPGTFSSKACAGVALVVAIPWIGYHEWRARAEKGHPFADAAQRIREQTTMPVIFFRAESHLLMFHLRQPVDTIREWENLAVWASQPFSVYVVSSSDTAATWRDHLPAGALEEVFRIDQSAQGKSDRPLVVLRSVPPGGGRAISQRLATPVRFAHRYNDGP